MPRRARLLLPGVPKKGDYQKRGQIYFSVGLGCVLQIRHELLR
jgi:hypothetical protein